LRLLLDTHALVWFLIEPRKLPPSLREILADPAHDVRVSAVSTWELAIKAGLGRLSLPLDRIERVIEEAGFRPLAVIIAHSLEVRHLPGHHRDPFDRLLVAQARCERLTLVSRDPAVRRYPIDSLWG
jgi:PIN domain nuclease of toxin-antitoxin system